MLSVLWTPRFELLCIFLFGVLSIKCLHLQSGNFIVHFAQCLKVLELTLIVKSTIKRQPSGISSIRKAFMNFDGNLTLISLLKGIDP